VKLKYIIIFSLIFKILIIFASHPIKNYDLFSYEKIGQLTLQKINIYPYPANIHYPYLPFYLYLEALAYLIKNFIPINVFLKLINLFFDLGVVYLIFLISRKKSRIALFYAFNLVNILIFYFHGQFDIIPIFFILLSISFFEQKKEFFQFYFISYQFL
jgi:hypothetical protein